MTTMIGDEGGEGSLEKGGSKEWETIHKTVSELEGEDTENEKNDKSMGDNGTEKNEEFRVQKEKEKKVGYGVGKNQKCRYKEIEKFSLIFRQSGEDSYESQRSLQKKDSIIEVSEEENVRGDEIVEWKEKGEEILNLMKMGEENGQLWSIEHDNDMDFRGQLIGAFEENATKASLIEKGVQRHDEDESVGGGNGDDLQLQERGENQSMVLYEEPVPLSHLAPIKNDSSDWVIKMTNEVHKMVGVAFEGHENEWGALFTAIETDRNSKILKARGKGSRELRSLTSSINYKDKDTRGIKLRGKSQMLDRQ